MKTPKAGDILLLDGLRNVAQEGLWIAAGVMPPLGEKLSTPVVALTLQDSEYQFSARFPHRVRFSVLTYCKATCTWGLNSKELDSLRFPES
jgi:hypothetical protein